MKIPAAAALLAALAAPGWSGQAPEPAKPALDKAAIEAYVRRLLMWSPQIQVRVDGPRPAPLPGYQEFTVTGAYGQASVDEIVYLSPDGGRLVRGAVYDTGASPFQRELSLLTTARQPALGTPGAPVTLVLFSDYQCSYCRVAAQQLRANLLKAFPTQVRLYFKDLPIDAIHAWARPAAIAGRCVFRQDERKFWEYHDWIFDKQSEIKPESLKEMAAGWAGSNGLDMVRFSRCLEQRETEPEIEASLAEARLLRVDSTPALFVNGRKTPGSIGFAQLKAIIEFELEQYKADERGGGKCCELALPTPAGNKP